MKYLTAPIKEHLIKQNTMTAFNYIKRSIAKSKVLKSLLIATVAVVGLPQGSAFEAQAQGQYSQNLGPTGITLTKDILDKATLTIFSFGDYPSNPENRIYGYISVSPTTVSMVLKEDLAVKYSDYVDITPEQYQNFIQQLAALEVQLSNQRDVYDGSPTYALVVMDNRQCLFSGQEGLNLTANNGDLSSPFMSVATTYMQDIFHNPTPVINGDFDPFNPNAMQ